MRKLTAPLRGRFEGIITDRLLRVLNALDQDVQIIVTAKLASRPRARTTVSVNDGRGSQMPIAAAKADGGDVMR